jgi:hypothetical protein
MYKNLVLDCKKVSGWYERLGEGTGELAVTSFVVCGIIFLMHASIDSVVGNRRRAGNDICINEQHGMHATAYRSLLRSILLCSALLLVSNTLR